MMARARGAPLSREPESDVSVTFRDRTRRPRPNRRRGSAGVVRRRWLLGAGGIAAGAGLLALAGYGSVRTADSRDATPPDPAPPEVVRCALRPLEIAPLPCASAILVEAETGAVLYEQNADEARGPASLVKMMLQLVIFDEIAAGRLALGDSVTTSPNASTMGGSQVFLKDGEVQTVESLLDAIIMASANDAAVAMAEHVAGSESACVERMNAKAREIGCRNTAFVNVHGLDLRRGGRNVTSARDLSIMARELVRHPKALEISSTRRKAFRGGEFWLDNTNLLLGDFEGLDGLKTGWTPRAGGCFVGTAHRDGVRLVAVVLRAPPGKGRFRVAAQLLEAGYRREPQWVEVAHPGQLVHPVEPVEVATDGDAAAAAWGTVRLLLESGTTGTWRLRPHPDGEGASDLAGTLGFLDYRLDGRTVATVPARAPGRS